MTALANSLSCLIALGCASFLWRKGSSPYRNGALLAGFLVLFSLFTYFAGDISVDPTLEHYPFRMLALCLCLSTTSLPLYRRRYLVLAQSLWCWIELFGGIALYYRGIDIAWTRILAVLGMTLCSTFLSKISKEMEFCLMVFWLAVWVFF
ncbi:hypothetical protein SAMN05720487_102139 [Fibrobacter sp. UWT2]|jgi:hypothetical protein|uniref:hypothetical protein n=1 Tax=Fibrobacter sp. UWT2 TaxID=1896224 RepID=UPI0009184078|nr:hypothetical protein [Fibrobacter sp. UWT2]SHK51762.1 hypothetical protein SAMN05720487_102139 [Fibrobacter sp. UWT2]